MWAHRILIFSISSLSEQDIIVRGLKKNLKNTASPFSWFWRSTWINNDLFTVFISFEEEYFLADDSKHNNMGSNKTCTVTVFPSTKSL